MCGIAGIIAPHLQADYKDRMKKALHQLAHRGPEGDGLYANENKTVLLGHRRLSIIDLSAAATQPMSYAGRYHISYNGEIYNYKELREELKKEGVSFFSQSDTEVVLTAYASWGEDCLQRFDGMFAFAIWDEQEQTFFAARDRFGEKPFFFSYQDEQLLFASELKGLLTLGAPNEVNSAMLYNFLSIGYSTNPADPLETFYKQISKLPAAHFLKFHLPTKELSVNRYWNVYTEVNETITETDAVEQFTAFFKTSVRRRLRSDVAIGTSLSGGLDSSAIVAFCQAFSAEQYSHKSFTAVFPGFGKDESGYAAQVATQFGLQHFTTTINEKELLPLMQRVAMAQDEPIASASPLAQYKVYEQARAEGVTVLLDGQGADEVLAGYHKYYRWWWQELYRQRKLGSSGERAAARQLGVQEAFGLTHKVAALWPQFTESLLQTKKSKEAAQHPDLNQEWAYVHKRDLYYSLPTSPDLNGALYFNTFVHGLEELLRLADRNSMAHSVEVRLPFLSHELVTFLFTLPPHFKIHQGWTKWLLRKSVDQKLPDSIVWRKDKVGFEPPQKQWMQQPDVTEAIRQAKQQLVYRGILNARVLHQKIQPHDAHAAESREWKYWSVGEWLRQAAHH